MKINKGFFKAKLINIFFNLCFSLKIKIFLKIFLQKYIVKKKSPKLIIYLSPQRSNYEVDFLIKNNFSLLKLPKLITNEIILFCVKKKINSNLSKRTKKDLNKINFFLKIFEEINLKLIISPAYHYTYDNLFAKLFSSKEIKYLIFHREGYNFSKNHLISLKNFIRKNQHKADKILVHNKMYENIFKKEIKDNQNKIEVLAPLRMQELIKYKNRNIKIKKPNKILFLSFTPAYAGGNPLKLGTLGQYGKLNKNNIKFVGQIKFNDQSDKLYDYEQFYFAHKVFFECILANPQYKFELRLKFNNDYNKELIINLCEKICGFIPKNFKIDEKNLWESISQSFFVCGYGSTGMLEASILNKPVIQIINKNLLHPRKKLNNLRISNHISSFKIVKTKKEFDKIFNKIVIKNKKLKEFVLFNKKAKLAFKNFIFNYKKNNNKKFLKIIFNLLK